MFEIHRYGAKSAQMVLLHCIVLYNLFLHENMYRLNNQEGSAAKTNFVSVNEHVSTHTD